MPYVKFILQVSQEEISAVLSKIQEYKIVEMTYNLKPDGPAQSSIAGGDNPMTARKPSKKVSFAEGVSAGKEVTKNAVAMPVKARKLKSKSVKIPWYIKLRNKKRSQPQKDGAPLDQIQEPKVVSSQTQKQGVVVRDTPEKMESTGVKQVEQVPPEEPDCIIRRPESLRESVLERVFIVEAGLTDEQPFGRVKMKLNRDAVAFITIEKQKEGTMPLFLYYSNVFSIEKYIDVTLLVDDMIKNSARLGKQLVCHMKLENERRAKTGKPGEAFKHVH